MVKMLPENQAGCRCWWGQKQKCKVQFSALPCPGREVSPGLPETPISKRSQSPDFLIKLPILNIRSNFFKFFKLNKYVCQPALLEAGPQVNELILTRYYKVDVSCCDHRN